jgi:unspecific monooxygenase
MLQILPPRPPLPTRQRTQLEAFLVIRRNMLEVWGPLAYEQDILFANFLGRKQVLVNAPEAIRHVLVANPENYRRNPATRRIIEPILGNGLFLAEGDAWRFQRRTVAPALSPRTLPVLAQHVATAAEAAEEKLALLTNRPLELLPHLQRLALDIAGRSMFSVDMSGFGEELRTRLTEYGLRYSQPGFLDILFPPGIKTPADYRRAAFRKEWLAFLDRLIAHRRGQALDPDRPRDLFDLLVLARDPETGEGFPDEQLRDEISTMILAGHETTAVALFWSCYLVALYPDYQASLAEEAATADLTPEAAHAALHTLPRTRAHLDEALRLYPPAFVLLRQALGKDMIAGHPIEPGAVITIAPWVIHRHKKYWRDPDGFDSSRFLPGAAEPERYTYLPFGAGPRICVGAQFALTEATLVMARLLRRFRLNFAGTPTVLPRAVVTTQPDRPVRFLLTERR